MYNLHSSAVQAAIESPQVPRGVLTVTKRLFAQQILTDSRPLSFKALFFTCDFSSELCKVLTGPCSLPLWEKMFDLKTVPAVTAKFSEHGLPVQGSAARSATSRRTVGFVAALKEKRKKKKAKKKSSTTGGRGKGYKETICCVCLLFPASTMM